MIQIATPEEAAAFGIAVPQPPASQPEPEGQSRPALGCLTCNRPFIGDQDNGLFGVIWDADGERWWFYRWCCGHNKSRRYVTCPTCHAAGKWVPCPECGRTDELT